MMKEKVDEEQGQGLAEMLDKNLDEWLAAREEKPYTEGWKEDNWEEEMQQHPFFMKKVPEVGEPLPPMLEALQQLKYDPNENTTEDLAVSYKDDGNFNFKLKKYRFAIANYTEGLNQKCGNKDIDASLHLNRAAANFHLSNYRSSLNDSLLAAKLKPDYFKAIFRATECCLKLKRYSDGLQWCDYGLKLDSNSEALVKIRTELIQGQKKEVRDKRKAEANEKKEQMAINNLVSAFALRKIKTGIKGKSDGQNISFDLSSIEPCHPAAHGKRVHLVNDSLVWPVLFLYPEFGETDFIQEFHEDSSFSEHLQLMFEEHPPWDMKKKYTAHNIHMYYENTESGKLYPVELHKPLKEILSQETFVLKAGTPGFICLVEGVFKKDFLDKYQ